MLFNFIILVLTTFALAAPTNKTCTSTTKYTLDIILGTSVAPLHAIDNGAGSVLLVADPTLMHAGTTFFEVGAGPNTEVDLEVISEPLSSQTGIFHLSVPDMGERHGSAGPVVGSVDATWPHWYTTEQNIWPQQTSGAQVFLACKTKVNGCEYTALSWGLAGVDGSMPEGCQGTIVRKKYNVRTPC